MTRHISPIRERPIPEDPIRERPIRERSSRAGAIGADHAETEAVRFDRLLMVLLLAACGGENRYLTAISDTKPETTSGTTPEPTPDASPDPAISGTPDATRADIALTMVDDRITGVVPERQTHVSSLGRLLAKLPGMTGPGMTGPGITGPDITGPEISNLVLVDARTVTFTIGSGAAARQHQLKIGGTDKGLVRFEAEDADTDQNTGPNTGPNTGLLNTAMLRFITTPDFEQPRDHDGNNSLALTLAITPAGTDSDSDTDSGTPASDSDPAVTTTNMALAIANNPFDGPTETVPSATGGTGPRYSRDGHLVTVSIEAGTTKILDLPNVDLRQSGSLPPVFVVQNDTLTLDESQGYFENLIVGTDSELVWLEITREGVETIDLRLEFREPVAYYGEDADRNVHQFAFWGVLAQAYAPLMFEVTVIPVTPDVAWGCGVSGAGRCVTRRPPRARHLTDPGCMIPGA